MDPPEQFQIVDAPAPESVATASYRPSASFSYHDESDPKVIDHHFNRATSIDTIDSECKKESLNIDSRDVRIETKSTEIVEIKQLQTDNTSRLDEQDDDAIQCRLAKTILKNMDKPPIFASLHARSVASSRFRITQLMINWHASVMREMFDLAPFDANPKEIVLRAYKTFETPGVSSISGAEFLKLSKDEQVDSILPVARQFADHCWCDYSITEYAKLHYMLDIEVKLFVKSIHSSSAGCCILL